jgi:hypothetical protein
MRQHVPFREPECVTPRGAMARSTTSESCGFKATALELLLPYVGWLIFPALSGPILRGSEVALSRHLAKILEKLIPAWVVDEQTTLTKINSQGLGKDYLRIRRGAEDTHLLDRESLRIIGVALGVRYIFQPRLISFSQTMTLRWKGPGLEQRVAETR